MSYDKTIPNEEIDLLDAEVRRRDWVLLGCYGVGAGLAGACLLLPYWLSQAGAVLMVVGFVYMICRLVGAYWALRRSGIDSGKLWLEGLHPRMDSVQSALFYLPFLVGANLLWMGLPLSEEPLVKAVWDCAFLGGTVILLSVSYVWNWRALRRLSGVREKICVSCKASLDAQSE